MTIRIMCAAMLATATATTPAMAQEPGSRPAREFVEAATQSDQFEILEAQAVLAQSKDPQIRGFAERMIRDHGEMALALRQAAARAGLKPPPPPPALGGDQALLLGALQGLRGAEFDRTYVRHQALAHRSALVVEQGYAASGDVPALRQAASAAASVIAGHLAMAERMQAAGGS